MLSLYDGKCVEYNGVCAEYLPLLVDETSLSTLTLSGVSQDDIDLFIDTITEYASESCQAAALPFLCQYIFPLCNVSSGDVNYINQAECINVRDVVCPVEWNFVEISALNSLLPNCKIFDHNENYSTTTVPQSLQCNYQFKEYCGLCLPLCGEFSQYRAETKLKEKAILIFGGSAAFIGGILVFILSACRWKAM